MGLYQRLKELNQAYVGGRDEARLEEEFRFEISFSTEPGRTAFLESHERARRAFAVDNIPEEGSPERTVYNFRYLIGNFVYFIRDMVD